MDLEQRLLHTPAASQWKSIGVHPHHGICVPLFSLHSEKSAGIGEYLDLLPLIKWCKEVKLQIIQLLPLNDMGLGTSPYSAISAFALNPTYLALHALPGVEKLAHFDERMTKVRYWSKTTRVKYHIVRELKVALLREYFDLHFTSMSHTKEYQTFVSENSWLKVYSLFKTIKEMQLWKEWDRWPIELKNPSALRLAHIYEEHKSLCDFQIFLQYLCYQQMKEVKEYATRKGILLKGDLPILINRDSADVWAHPEYFHMDVAAGAPPDMYSDTGQYWGFPIYNWDALAKNDYGWWKERLRLASSFYHLYRIDHVMGFYRTWAIPLNKPALEGHYLPPEETQQRLLGDTLMTMMLESAPILPIGEDLGLVPEWIKEALRKLGISGTKVMRWERKWSEEGQPYIDPKEYPPLSVTTVSTHDSDTLQLWWRHFPKEAKAFSEFKNWNYLPFLTHERHKEILYDSHHSSSLFHINLLSEYLTLFPDLAPPHLDDRINIPGKVLDRNWTYRFHPTLETLTDHHGLKSLFKELLF